jgi:hypothetical protein
MSSKDQLIELYKTQLTRFLDSRYLETDHEQQAMEVLSQDILSEEVGNSETIEKVNRYVTRVMSEAAIKGYKESRDRAIKASVRSFDKLVDDLFTEEEIKEVIAFVKSPLGSKLVRNTDLFRESWQSGHAIIVAHVVSYQNDPVIFEGIRKFVESLENPDEENDDDIYGNS